MNDKNAESAPTTTKVVLEISTSAAMIKVSPAVIAPATVDPGPVHKFFNSSFILVINKFCGRLR